MSFVLDSIQECYDKFMLNCETKNLATQTTNYYKKCHKLFVNVVGVDSSVGTISNKTIK